MPFFQIKAVSLNDLDICRSRAFFSLLYVKSDPVAFFKGLETDCIDGRMMNEYIRSIFLLNEAVSLFSTEPLYSSICHSDTPSFLLN